MNRRNFLGAMLAAASAPAVVKAENLMKIFVPPERKILQPIYYPFTKELDDPWLRSNVYFDHHTGRMYGEFVGDEEVLNVKCWDGSKPLQGISHLSFTHSPLHDSEYFKRLLA